MTRFDPFFGPVFPDIGWIPSIRYLMRRDRILALLTDRPRTSILEVGCGSGALLAELAEIGFHCTGLETSDSARTMANEISRRGDIALNILGSPHPDFDHSFDLVCAFDVLEHIEDDHAAIESWKRWVKPGGHLLITVPAHSKRWGPGDVWAGHFRRYDENAFKDLLNTHGMTIEHFECYGFPAANISEWLGKRVYARLLEERARGIDRAQATAMSGIQRKPYSRIYGMMRTPIGKMLLSTCYFFQNRFSSTNLGSGYIILARKP
ncbi:MAG: class I SAM-dependent methyltransferase [Xanthomonadaceae bacterium]|nr:class I SAM-dependent methyltransferase [Xanthomonadaceae bacterium]